MGKVRAVCMSTSIDGFGAGLGQSLDNPFGLNAMPLTGWQFQTRAFQEMIGRNGGSEGIDNDFVIEKLSADVYGAHIIGRNMFDPNRGEWNLDWKGWWGDDPPYHHATFVLTHYEREPLEMDGGTTFYFVTEGIESAVRQAQEAAGDKDVQIGGGAATLNQTVHAGLLDELHLVQSPVVVGAGERMIDEKSAEILRSYQVKYTPSQTVGHVQFTR